MSHGKIVALGTPMNIKRRFGVGYNVYVEARAASNLSTLELYERLGQAERIFLGDVTVEGITKSRDSTDKKFIFLVPITLIDRVGALIAQIEQTLPEL